MTTSYLPQHDINYRRTSAGVAGGAWGKVLERRRYPAGTRRLGSRTGVVGFRFSPNKTGASMSLRPRLLASTSVLISSLSVGAWAQTPSPAAQPLPTDEVPAARCPPGRSLRSEVDGRPRPRPQWSRRRHDRALRSCRPSRSAPSVNRRARHQRTKQLSLQRRRPLPTRLALPTSPAAKRLRRVWRAK